VPTGRCDKCNPFATGLKQTLVTTAAHGCRTARKRAESPLAGRKVI